MMDLIGWILIGLLASVVGELILPGRNPGGVTVTILIGMAGALVGRFVMGLVGGDQATEFNIWSIVVATVGALVMLAVYRLFVGQRRA